MAMAPFTYENPFYPDYLPVGTGHASGGDVPGQQLYPSLHPPFPNYIAPSADVPRNRYIIDKFRDLVCSSPELSLYADDILSDIHAFILAHGSLAPLTAGTEHVGPMLFTGQTSVDGAEQLPKSPQASADGRADECRFNDCGEAIRELTVRGVTQHLLQYHFHHQRSDWQKADDPVQCLWPDCRYRGTLKKRSLARHICTSHLKLTEVKCGVSGCNAVLSRPDGLERHILRVHGSAYGGAPTAKGAARVSRK